MSRAECLPILAAQTPVILPSLLLCDFSNLKLEVERLEAAGAQALHLDIMDGQFVPNLTYGMPIVESLRRVTQLPLDAHLMIDRPERYIQSFYQAGADIITIHAEAVADPRRTLTAIRDLGAGAGIALNPQTPLSLLEELTDICNLVLIMGVNAGFGGQSFQPTAVDRLRKVRQLMSPDTVLEVDGGIHVETIGMCAEAGAQFFVTGSAIFREPDYDVAMNRLRQLATTF